MERLDELSKLLAASVSRRESLRTIGVVLAGAALSAFGVNTAWAARPDRCTAFCRSCPTKKKRDQCMEACRACNGNTSRLCGSCGAYVCCAAGTTCCNGTCTDLNSDANNCGACGNICPASAPICNQGTCSGCPTGRTFCYPSCVDLSVNPYNCGTCGLQCAPSEVCAGGLCQGICIGCE
jgi:Stigma-specific protein, Stig1